MQNPSAQQNTPNTFQTREPFTCRVPCLNPALYISVCLISFGVMMSTSTAILTQHRPHIRPPPSTDRLKLRLSWCCWSHRCTLLYIAHPALQRLYLLQRRSHQTFCLLMAYYTLHAICIPNSAARTAASPTCRGPRCRVIGGLIRSPPASSGLRRG